MIRIKELLDNPVNYKITVKKDKAFEAKFTVEGYEYTVLIDTDSGIGWDIQFGLEDIDDGPKTGITGTGHQFTVFSSVGAILEYFIKSYKPEAFFFSAHESSRKKLYDIFAKKISTKFNYEITIKKDQYYSNMYYFKRLYE